MSIVINRCGDCGHNHLEHALTDGSRCSFGYCPCVKSRPTVQSVDPEETIPTFPAFDHASGKWATS